MYNLVTEIVKDCSTVVLLKALIMDEFTSVRDYALEHFISESTVRRDMSKVQKLLERYHIEIGRENFQLQGEEYQIRMCMVIFSGAFFRGSSWPFDYVNEQLIDSYVDEVLNSKFTVYPKIPYTYKTTIIHFAEAIIRTRKGNILKMPEALETQITTNQLYPRFKEIICQKQGAINTKQSEIPFFF